MAKKSGAGGIILLAVDLAMVAVYFIFRMQRQHEMESSKYWTEVVTAQQDIPAKTKITRDMVTLTRYPKELVVEGAIKRSKGRRWPHVSLPNQSQGPDTRIRPLGRRAKCRTGD